MLPEARRNRLRRRWDVARKKAAGGNPHDSKKSTRRGGETHQLRRNSDGNLPAKGEGAGDSRRCGRNSRKQDRRKKQPSRLLPLLTLRCLTPEKGVAGGRAEQQLGTTRRDGGRSCGCFRVGGPNREEDRRKAGYGI